MFIAVDTFGHVGFDQFRRHLGDLVDAEALVLLHDVGAVEGLCPHIAALPFVAFLVLAGDEVRNWLQNSPCLLAGALIVSAENLIA